MDTLKSEKRERLYNLKRYLFHRVLSNFALIFLLQISLCVTFGLVSFLSFDLQDCGLNTYDTGEGVCNDCLSVLGITCKECTSQKICDVCKPGYLQFTNAADATICRKCSSVFGDKCAECSNTVCTKCNGNFYLKNDKCEDCVSMEGCETCNDEGCN